jgi:protein-disulfide isomerase
VRIVFRYLAPENDPAATLPHRAAVAAERQTRFWDMERLLFANQDRRSREDLIGMAAQLQLDVERFTRDLDDPALDVVIDGDRARATMLHVVSAPAVFVNGKPMAGERTLKHLESVIAAAAVAR